MKSGSVLNVLCNLLRGLSDSQRSVLLYPASFTVPDQANQQKLQGARSNHIPMSCSRHVCSKSAAEMNPMRQDWCMYSYTRKCVSVT